MSYFNQVLRHDFTPLSNPLILSKILIVIDEPSADENQEADSSYESEEESKQEPMALEVMDYAKMTENLFFRVFEGTVEEETLLFDQLDQNSKIDAATGLPMMSIGEAIVTVNARVQNDFQIRCFRNNYVEQ